MAVSVDTVYQRVLAILNKEQRGYVTPQEFNLFANQAQSCLLYTSPSPRDAHESRMPSSA